MFKNDYAHEESHQIAAKTRPLFIDDAVMNQMMLNFFICNAEELDILFEVVSNAKKTESIDELKSNIKDEEME